MSNKVVTWASQQKAGGPSAKLVLIMLADFADELGASHYSNTSIAATCEISVDTLQRHMAALEDLGLIARVPTYRKDGSRSTNKIFCLYTPAARAEAIRLGWTGDTGKSPGIEPPADCGGGAANCGGAPRTGAVTPPQLCGAQKEPSLNQERKAMQSEKEEAIGGAPNGWGRFAEAWGFDGKQVESSAEREFDRLTADEQEEAIKGAKAVRSGPNPTTTYATVWLRERSWRKVETDRRQPKKPTSKASKPTVWIEPDSAEWEAWRDYHAAEGKAFKAMQCARGWGRYVESRWPPKDASASAA